VKTRFELRTICYDTMINYYFSQKLKLLENGKFNPFFFFFFFLGGGGGGGGGGISEFNYLIIILTFFIFHFSRSQNAYWKFSVFFLHLRILDLTLC
jgi:hypothetical protein